MANFIFHYPTRAADPTGSAGASIAGLEAYPSIRPIQFCQQRAVTGGNVAKVRSLGGTIYYLDLSLKNISSTAFDDLQDFMIDTANGAINSFDVTDHNGVQYNTCRFWQDDFSPSLESPTGRYSGTVHIRAESKV